jgi:hypothetical protein
MPPAARGSFEKPPLDPAKLFIKSFWKSRKKECEKIRREERQKVR